MSFFFINRPASITSRMIRPAEQTTTESGAVNRRFSGVAYWTGSIDFVPQTADTTVYGELERASAQNGSFYADLYNKSEAPPTPVWVTVVDAPTGYENSASLFAVNSTSDQASYATGDIVSFRRVVPGTPSQQAASRQFVTARIITGRSIESGKYIYELETPLPQEYVASGGAVIEACFNRPHVRALLSPDSIQWTAAQARFTTPATVDWVEDVGTAMAFLNLTLNSPTGGVHPPLEDYLMNEAGTDFLITEDGSYLITED